MTNCEFQCRLTLNVLSESEIHRIVKCLLPALDVDSTSRVILNYKHVLTSNSQMLLC